MVHSGGLGALRVQVEPRATTGAVDNLGHPVFLRAVHGAEGVHGLPQRCGHLGANHVRKALRNFRDGLDLQQQANHVPVAQRVEGVRALRVGDGGSGGGRELHGGGRGGHEFIISGPGCESQGPRWKVYCAFPRTMIQSRACRVAGLMVSGRLSATTVTASAMARYSVLLGASLPSPAARHIHTSTTTALASPAMARANAFVFRPRRPSKPSRQQRSAATTWERRPFGVMPCAYCRALALLWPHVTRGEKADTTDADTSRVHSGRMIRSDCAKERASAYHDSAARRSSPVARCSRSKKALIARVRVAL